MSGVYIRRAAALLALAGQLLLPLPLFAMTLAGGDAICSAHAASAYDHSAPAGALHGSGHCALCAMGLGCAAPPASAPLAVIAFSPPRALAPPALRGRTLVRHALADARAPRDPA
jgi:hypothetical protein